MSQSLLNSTVASLLPYVPKPLVWRVSRRYIAGVSLEDAFRVIERLNEQGISATIDLLGEDVHEEQKVRASRDLYLEALSEIAARRLDCNVSIKLSELGLRFDEQLCRGLVDELVTAAAERDNFVRIDMEDSSVTSVTLDIYRELRQRHRAVGAVIQSYLRRSREDVDALLEQGIAHLRLCKGIYVEPPEIAFQEPEETNVSFRELLERLFTGGAEKVGIATHDPALVEFAKTLIRDRDIPVERYEFQMLLGVAERLRTQLVQEGFPMRVYVPFGEHWFAYSARRLRENPEIAGHVIRHLFSRD